MKASPKWKRQGLFASGILLCAACLYFRQTLPASAETAAKANKYTPEAAVSILAQHKIKTARFLVTGDRDGMVTFADFQRKVFKVFQMEKGQWAREVFVLDDGKTAAASQRDHTVFWDTKTGKETGRVPEHVYAFSHDKKYFLAQNRHDKISLYEYPALKRIGQFPPTFLGLSAFLFSPDDRYCVVEVESAFPAPEERYPFVHANKKLSAIRMYTLNPIGEVPNFAALGTLGGGTFTADSSAYIADYTFYNVKEKKWTNGPWRFDLQTFTVKTVEPQKKPARKSAALSQAQRSQ